MKEPQRRGVGQQDTSEGDERTAMASHGVAMRGGTKRPSLSSAEQRQTKRRADWQVSGTGNRPLSFLPYGSSSSQPAGKSGKSNDEAIALDDSDEEFDDEILCWTEETDPPPSTARVTPSRHTARTLTGHKEANDRGPSVNTQTGTHGNVEGREQMATGRAAMPPAKRREPPRVSENGRRTPAGRPSQEEANRRAGRQARTQKYDPLYGFPVDYSTSDDGSDDDHDSSESSDAKMPGISIATTVASASRKPASKSIVGRSSNGKSSQTNFRGVARARSNLESRRSAISHNPSANSEVAQKSAAAADAPLKSTGSYKATSKPTAKSTATQKSPFSNEDVFDLVSDAEEEGEKAKPAGCDSDKSRSVHSSDDSSESDVNTEADDDRKLPARENNADSGPGGRREDEAGLPSAAAAPIAAAAPADAEDSDEEGELTRDDIFCKSGPEPYTTEEFGKILTHFEKVQLRSLQEIEDGSLVRQQKQKHNDQYGRIVPRAMERIFDEVGLCNESAFLDIGHGIGTLCAQAAYTRGCLAKGIECAEGRHLIATTLSSFLKEINDIHKTRDKATFRPGFMRLKNGDLQDKEYRKFLTKGVDVAFCNNYGGVFDGTRDPSDGRRHLDDHVAALFALMKEGAKLVTMHPIDGPLRCLPLTASKEIRKNHGLPHGDNESSFYEVTKCYLGLQKDVCAWSEGGSCTWETYCYIYTRVHQAADNKGNAVFKCNNRPCKNSNTVMNAVRYDDQGAYIATCNECGINQRSRRDRQTVNYAE